MSLGTSVELYRLSVACCINLIRQSQGCLPTWSRTILKYDSYDVLFKCVLLALSFCEDRQKLILLADSSPYGWTAVLEYKHHDLANDGEDEKICRAEANQGQTRIASTTARGLLICCGQSTHPFQGRIKGRCNIF